jgi:hypothetical protein
MRVLTNASKGLPCPLREVDQPDGHGAGGGFDEGDEHSRSLNAGESLGVRAPRYAFDIEGVTLLAAVGRLRKYCMDEQ